MATLYIIGAGPGSIDHLTQAALRAIAESTVVIGYDGYIELIRPLLAGKEIASTGMTQEIERCRNAIQRARTGDTVALVSGGDAGIYGMAGLALELLEIDAGAGNDEAQPEVRIIPGISAIQAAASLLGAPLMHDFAAISLSDLLTPWELIKTRLAAAARSDFVIALFNPRSKNRTTQLKEAQSIILASRSAKTPSGIVRNACRPDESVIVTTLGELPEHGIDMSTIVIIGNGSSFVDRHGRMVTPRGYAEKMEAIKSSLPPGGGGLGWGGSCHETKKLQLHPPPSPLPSRVGEPEDVPPHPGAIMFCGTASDVGKSVITAGFCRYLVKRGIAVAPFKSQNMSLNSFVTIEGGEIGRAQAVQAQACNIAPHSDMNPILLKPNSDTGSQVIVQGKAVANMNVSEYESFKPRIFSKVLESYKRLKSAYDFIVIEGAGSISEINLKQNDIANLKVAMMARCPVILVADIDRGGVFAQIVGTIDLLEPEERACIKGVIINKFRGDTSILSPGLDFIRERTGVPVLGVLPWMPDLSLPAEDSVALGQRSKVVNIPAGQKSIRVGVLKLSRLSNFTDFDPLQAEPDVVVSYIERPEELEGLDILILPGSKSTIADLFFLMERGLYDAVKGFGGRIIGICGGYQMLGLRVLDPDGVESPVKEAAGIGLLPVETVILPQKETHQVQAHLVEPGLAIAYCRDVINGYEIHMGRTNHLETPRHFSRIFQRGNASVNVYDGSVSADDRIFGTYLHGIFENAGFREVYLNRIRQEKGMPVRSGGRDKAVDDPFDLLAAHMEQHLDMKRILAICGLSEEHA